LIQNNVYKKFHKKGKIWFKKVLIM